MVGKLVNSFLPIWNEVRRLVPEKDPMYDPVKEKEYTGRVRRNVVCLAWKNNGMGILWKDYDAGQYNSGAVEVGQ